MRVALALLALPLLLAVTLLVATAGMGGALTVKTDLGVVFTKRTVPDGPLPDILAGGVLFVGERGCLRVTQENGDGAVPV